MRGVVRRLARDEEEESAFVSMTDLTVSFLFIVIILLAFFASQLKDDKTVPVAEYDAIRVDRDVLRTERDAVRTDRDALRLDRDALRHELRRLTETNAALTREVARLEEELRQERANRLQTYLATVSLERTRILQLLKDRLLVSFPDMRNFVDVSTDALQLKGDGLFDSGRSDLKGDRRRIVEAIAASLNELLPCYTFGKDSRWRQECNAAGAVIEAVQIEGHTDATGPTRSNFDLSAVRAIETLFAMSVSRPGILDFRNIAEQPVLSVAGYGPLRPVADNRTETGKATNRRIDLRIIMYTPQSVEDVERVRTSLRRGMAGTTLQ